MKAASDAYRAAMRSNLRGRSYVEVSFENVDTSAATDGSWDGAGAAWSEEDTLDYGYAYGATYAALELNRWALDGGSVVRPAEGPMRDGFVSAGMTGADGSRTSAVVLDRSFTDDHALLGLTVTFDTRCGEWPEEVSAAFYLDGEVVGSATVQPTGAKAVLEARVPACDRVVLTIGGGLPYRRARVERVLWGIQKTFTNSDLVSTKQAHDVDPLSRRLPQETMEFTVLDPLNEYDPDNPVGIYAYIDQAAPAAIRFGHELADGTVEWVKADRYVLDSRPKAAKHQATFSGVGRIGSMTGRYYKGKLGDQTLYALAQDVLEDAGLPPTETGADPWVIDESLKQMHTTAALPIDSHAVCLQTIAHAARCRLYTDDDNVIHIEPFGVTKTGLYRGTWSDDGHEGYSEWGTVDRGDQPEDTYATLELNRWALDSGEQILLPDEKPSGRGYISAAMTGADGAFTNAPVVVRTFDVARDLPVVAVQFDPVLGEGPRSMVVRWYAGSTLLDSQEVTGIGGAEATARSLLARGCDKVTLELGGGLPYRRARIRSVRWRETDFTMGFSTISENGQTLSLIDRLQAVTVAKWSHAAEAEAKTLYEGTTDETTLHIEFDSLAQDVSVAVTGGTVVSQAVYARAADLVLSEGTKTVVVTGKAVTESSVVVTYPVAAEGEVDAEENPLITNDEMCAALAAHVKAYLQMRNTYDMSYRGDPVLEVGDVIGVQTQWTDELDGLVLTDELTFNGSLSGKAKVKALI